MAKRHKKQARTYNGPVDARGTSFGSGNVYHVDAAAADSIRDLADQADSDEPGDGTSTTVFFGTVTADGSTFGDAPTHNTFTRESGADDCDGY